VQSRPACLRRARDPRHGRPRRFLLSDAKGRFGGVVKAAGRKMPTGLLAQDEPPPPPPPPLHLPRIPNAVGALGTEHAACSAV